MNAQPSTHVSRDGRISGTPPTASDDHVAPVGGQGRSYVPSHRDRVPEPGRSTREPLVRPGQAPSDCGHPCQAADLRAAAVLRPGVRHGIHRRAQACTSGACRAQRYTAIPNSPVRSNELAHQILADTRTGRHATWPCGSLKLPLDVGHLETGA
jgi:hypothetical protein